MVGPRHVEHYFGLTAGPLTKPRENRHEYGFTGLLVANHDLQLIIGGLEHVFSSRKRLRTRNKAKGDVSEHQWTAHLSDCTERSRHCENGQQTNKLLSHETLL